MTGVPGCHTASRSTIRTAWLKLSRCSISSRSWNISGAPTLDFALGYYHLVSWLAQPNPFPEWLISRAPEEWWRPHTARDTSLPDLFHPDALADYLAAVRQPEMVRGMCEDYRAAATIDLKHDRASPAARIKVHCPMLAL